MARIEAKNKEKLSSTIGAWIVFGILGAVVITGIILLIIYLVDLGKVDEEKTFEERFPVAEEKDILMTYEELDAVLEGDTGIDPKYEGIIYVFVYNPDFETFKDEDVTWVEDDEDKSGKLTEFIDSIVKKVNVEQGIIDNFFIINVENEDNKDFSGSNIPTFDNYPTLLVIENGEIIDEPIKDVDDIELAESGTITLPNQIITVLSKLN